jgi:hypothetical protein
MESKTSALPTHPTYSVASAAVRVAAPAPVQPGGATASEGSDAADSGACTERRSRVRARVTFEWRRPIRTWSQEEETFVALRRGCSE